MDWSWVGAHLGQVVHYTGRNAYLGLVSVLIGLAISVPLGVLCARFRWLYVPVSAISTALYAIPSLAFFVVLLNYYGLQDETIIIPLSLFSLSVLVPAVVDGLHNVPEHVRQSATAMGFGPMRRLFTVELPVAVPVVTAGMRVATVSSLSLVSVGSLLGSNFGGLGYYFNLGDQQGFPTAVWTGIVAVVILALVADLVIIVIGYLLTPWARRPSGRRLISRRAAQAGASAA